MLKLTNWSYSRYSTWKKCPALLKYQIEDERPRETHPAAQRGTDYHLSIEQYLRGEGDLLEDLKYYNDFLDLLKVNGARPEVKLCVTKDWKMCDWEFPDRWWRGILDAVIEQGSKAVIYDWKTGQEYPDHREQREVYAAVYFSAKPVEEIDVYHVYLDKKQTTKTVFMEDEILTLRRKWEDNAEAMLNDKAFAPNPSFMCRSCRYSRDRGGPCRF